MSSPNHLESDIDRGTTMIAIYSVQCVISLLFLLLRLWARIINRGKGWDDAFMVITWVSSWDCSIHLVTQGMALLT